ncbi:MAG TPA: hypothetical protein VFQ34_02020, partial [Nitrospiraceae bacterium]|nr:hypothetical protein [Nitrospiraceae bacterium]
MDTTNQSILRDAASSERIASSLTVGGKRLLERLPSRTRFRWWGARGRKSQIQPGGFMAGRAAGNPWFISGFVLALFLVSWHLFTLRPAFDQKGFSEEQLQLMEFNGDIIRLPGGQYA